MTHRAQFKGHSPAIPLRPPPRRIGLARARNFLFTNSTFNAQQALELGLVVKMVPDDRLEKEGTARSLAEGPAEVMGLAKQIFMRTFESSLDDLMLYEGLGQARAQSSAEFKEGLRRLRQTAVTAPAVPAARPSRVPDRG